MSQQATERTGLSEEVRLRLPLPIVVPVGAMVVIAAVAIGFSKILLEVPKEVAVLLAIATAANVLAVCTFIALRPNTARAFWAELLIVATYPVVIGAAIAIIGIGEGHSVGEAAATETAAGAHGEAAGGGGLVVTAQNVAFDTDTLELTADEEQELLFQNNDAASVPHNVAIYEDDSASAEIFVGEVIDGGSETTYTIPATPKGEYYFQCDVHPSMSGTASFK